MSMAANRAAALVFVTSDSGEGYITVDGNEGDRYSHVLRMRNEDL